MYHSTANESSSGILLFTDSRSELQVILRGNSQLTYEIINIANRIVAVQRTCTLLWILAHVDIFVNEQADSLAEEARNSPELSSILALIDSDATVKCKLTFQPPKKNSIPNLNCNRVISTTIAGLLTGHFKGMKIFSDD